MNTHRRQKDGALRDGDNWQKGMPKDAYMKSLIRHVFEAWKQWRSLGRIKDETLCAVIFNAMGMLYEQLTVRSKSGLFPADVVNTDPNDWTPFYQKTVVAFNSPDGVSQVETLNPSHPQTVNEE